MFKIEIPLLTVAIKEAVKVGLIKGGEVDAETYMKNWQGMESVLIKFLEAYNPQMIEENERLRAANEWRYINEVGVPADSGKYLVTNEYGLMHEIYYDLSEGEWRTYDAKYEVKVIAWREIIQAAEVK